jgi:2-oxoglutarate dehydrogenase E1 component
MATGTYFDRVIGEREEVAADNLIRRVVLCSGKVYYDLLAGRVERGITDIALLRLEQLYPFPFFSLTKELRRYPTAQIVWCQEEPANMGAWTFLDRRIEKVLADAGSQTRRPVLVSRAESASPAAGLARRHGEEQAALVNEALSLA